MPCSHSRSSSSGAGWPYLLPRPDEMTAARGARRCRKWSDDDVFEPWCPTFSRSHGPSQGRDASSVSRSASPGNTRECFPARSCKIKESRFVWVASTVCTMSSPPPAAATVKAVRPMRHCSPRRRRVTGRAAGACRNRDASSGVSSPCPRNRCPTGRLAKTVRAPPIWSKSPWLRIRASNLSMPR